MTLSDSEIKTALGALVAWSESLSDMIQHGSDPVKQAMRRIQASDAELLIGKLRTELSSRKAA